MTHQLTPDDEAIRDLAEALVDVLEERGLFTRNDEPVGRVLNVGDVAKLLGRSRQWVYEHASELGAFRFTSGPRGRIGFDHDEIERWKRDRRDDRSIPAARTAHRRGRPRKSTTAAGVPLIPYEPSPYRA